MTRTIILEKNINNDLWPELVFTMIHVKNSWLIKVLQNLSSYKALTWDYLNISPLRILESIIYIFLHKEKLLLKLEKWPLRALKGILVSYNSHTIYWMHIKEYNKVIRIKNFRIFGDYKSKMATALPNYENNILLF